MLTTSMITIKRLFPDHLPADMKLLSPRRKEKLDRLVNRHAVMLFMKGTPEEPECGFSGALVELLEHYKADYKTYNILKHEKVREGLKLYSDWPTFPQLYVKGELVGGLDVVKTLHANGELKDTLFPQPPCPVPPPADPQPPPPADPQAGP